MTIEISTNTAPIKIMTVRLGVVTYNKLKRWQDEGGFLRFNISIVDHKRGNYTDKAEINRFLEDNVFCPKTPYLNYIN